MQAEQRAASRVPDSRAAEPEKVIEHQRLARRLRQMLDSTLDPIEARVLALHYGYEMPLATITQRLSLSNPSGAKAYVVNARRKLSGVIQRRQLNSSLLSLRALENHARKPSSEAAA